MIYQSIRLSISLSSKFLRRSFGAMMGSPIEKLTSLRKEFDSEKIDAYLLPSTDAHQSEYLAEFDFRVKFLSGFSGSNAFVLVTKEKALLWTDGRYFIQAKAQMSADWTMMTQALKDSISPEDWINSNVEKGAVIGFDPDIMTYDEAKSMSGRLSSVGFKMRPIHGNLVDRFWKERPTLPNKKLICLSKEETGASVDEKLTRVREELKKRQCKALVLLALDDVMWTLNIRGGDIQYNPLAYSVLLVTDKDAHLFIDSVKLDSSSRSHLSDVSIHEYTETKQFLTNYSKSLEGTNATVFIPGTTNYAIGELFESRMYQGVSPIQGMKAKKNNVELEGIRRASIRDAVALSKYLVWLEEKVIGGADLTEDAAGKKIDEIRTHEEKFVDLSFDTISAVGPHAALPHYHPSNGSELVKTTTNEVFLVDSGAQYRDGTTDVTRTVWYGNKVPAEFRRDNTLVLMAHIDMATTVFPVGINGIRLDAISRMGMWKYGLDYNHGLGHGVGHFLNVHEAPGISHRRYSDHNLLYEGTVITIEPGLYMEGKWGIRIENVYELVPATVPSGAPFLTFKPLTWLPIQREIIDVTMLEERHKQWLNDYHSKTLSILKGNIDERTGDHTKELEWLKKACAPI
ncbi:hypothetical protein PFISCL1PPCAC_20779 [Pristionchus fissidentatus]|uniref:Uncharacterized protein n=1 Tax=Pristionchus fissidentatus TaxID=1538716 RepID=A0AAV5WCA0_9BILA|nr:hypothetical protein PFISCL1PPCAC_20779 [Pristionchus fissidentatus]